MPFWLRAVNYKIAAGKLIDDLIKNWFTAAFGYHQLGLGVIDLIRELLSFIEEIYGAKIKDNIPLSFLFCVTGL